MHFFYYIIWDLLSLSSLQYEENPVGGAGRLASLCACSSCNKYCQFARDILVKFNIDTGKTLPSSYVRFKTRKLQPTSHNATSLKDILFQLLGHMPKLHFISHMVHYRTHRVQNLFMHISVQVPHGPLYAVLLKLPCSFKYRSLILFTLP